MVLVTRVAIEDTLEQMKQALTEQGYEVTTFQSGSAPDDCDCCIISGTDENMMGIQTTVTEAPVIDARGMNIEELCDRIDHEVQ